MKHSASRRWRSCYGRRIWRPGPRGRTPSRRGTPATAGELNAGDARSLIFRQGETQTVVTVAYRGTGYGLAIDGAEVSARGEIDARGQMRVEFDGVRMDAAVIAAGGLRHVFLHGRTWRLSAIDPLYFAGEGGGVQGGLLAPMPGKVIALLAEAGKPVDKGAPLMILEAMKMEHTITAPSAGLLKAFRFAVGDQVTDGVELVEFEPVKA